MADALTMGDTGMTRAGAAQSAPALGRSARLAPAFEFSIEPGKAREFARATSSGVESDARFGTLAPVTFLTSSALWMSPENSAWFGVDRDFRRVLHGEQHFSYPSGLPDIGSSFTARQRIDKTYEKVGSRGTMVFSEIVTDFWTNDEAEPAATMTAVSIALTEHRPSQAPTGPSAQTGHPAPRPDPDRREILRFTAPPLTVTDFVKYQGASGDFNPIHHDTGFAQAAGYPGPFAVGMLTAGIAADLVGAAIGLDRLRGWTTRWKSQAWPGDALEYLISDARSADDVPKRISVDVRRPGGELHMQAWAQFE